MRGSSPATSRTEEEGAGEARCSRVQGTAPTLPCAENADTQQTDHSPPSLQESTPHTVTGTRKGPEVTPGAGRSEPARVSSPEVPCKASGPRSEVGFKHPLSVLRLFSWEKPETSWFSDGRKYPCVWTQVRRPPCFSKTRDFYRRGVGGRLSN